MPSRFEADYNDPSLEYDLLVDEVFSELQSRFLDMPRGQDFTEYAVFEQGYQALKRATNSFTDVSTRTVEVAISAAPIAFTVFRSILGFSAPELAYVTTEMTGVEVAQNAARTIDRKLRLQGARPKPIGNSLTDKRVRAMIDAGVQTLLRGAVTDVATILHRLDKADTRNGIVSIQPLADLGVPYAVLLYERFLGRPFASHRDGKSELVGEIVEGAIKEVLDAAKVTYRVTGRAERINGFEQAPDFIIPDEFNPAALIEAKLTEDDGTARDKVTRVQHLRTLRDRTKLTYDVIACIDGRGFKIRRADMKRLLWATDGKVFTLATMHLLVDNTRIGEYRVR